MRSLLFVLVASCGGSTSTATVSNASGSSQPRTAASPPVCDDAKCALATFEAFTERLCACTDTACAEKVTNEALMWRLAMLEKASKLVDHLVDPLEDQAMTDVGKKYNDCRTKLSTPPPDPCGG